MPPFQPRPLQYWNRKWLPKPLHLPYSRQLLPGGLGWWVWSCGHGHWLVYTFRFALEDSVEKLSTSAVAIATPLPPSDDDSDSFYSLDGESMDEGGKEGGVTSVAAPDYSHKVVLSNGWVTVAMHYCALLWQQEGVTWRQWRRSFFCCRGRGRTEKAVGFYFTIKVMEVINIHIITYCGIGVA